MNSNIDICYTLLLRALFDNPFISDSKPLCANVDDYVVRGFTSSSQEGRNFKIIKGNCNYVLEGEIHSKSCYHSTQFLYEIT